MEQIYQIPVNEAFFESAEKTEITECTCPFCSIYRKLEENELDLILGASMMEPDTRIKTNKLGFCKTHYDMMFTRKNRLGMALMLESHLDELMGDMKVGLGGLLSAPAQKSISRISELEKNCYVCQRIEYHFERMIETAVLLWENDINFPPVFQKQKYFCLPHYRRMLSYAKERLSKKVYAEFVRQSEAVEFKYFEQLKEDISWFCKKFDYRYDQEPWYNSKDAVERAIKFLGSDIHRKKAEK